MHIIWALVIGAVVGALYQLFFPSRHSDGSELIIVMLLGIAGSLVGSFIERSFEPLQTNHSAIGSMVCAALLLVIYKLITRPRKR